MKLSQGLGLPAEIALEDVPGFTGQKLDRAINAIRKQQGRAALSEILSGGQSAVSA